MRLLSKCEYVRLRFKDYVLVFAGLLGLMAFFIPPAFCEIYFQLCREFHFLRHFDKIFHVLFFASLTFFLPFPESLLQKMAVVFLILLLGLNVEVIQYFIPHRGSSLQDMLANILGIICGLLIRLCTYNVRKILKM